MDVKKFEITKKNYEAYRKKENIILQKQKKNSDCKIQGVFFILKKFKL